MGIDKIKKKKKKRKIYFSGKRVGFEPGGMAGSDGRGGDGGSSSSSSDDNDNFDYESAAYDTTPAASYSEPDTSGDDQEEDVFNVMEELGIKDTFNSPTVDVSTITGEDGYGEGDYDDGRSLYTSNTQITKENQPYVNYTPGPNTVTAQELYNLNRGLGDSDQQAATLANIQAINPIEKQGIFDSGIGKLAKNVGKGLLTLAAPQIGGLAFGKTGYDAVNLGLKGKRAYDFAKKFAPNTTRDIKTAFTKDFQLGTGGEPPVGTGFDNDGGGENNTLVANNVIAKNVQKYSPEYINRAIDLRDRLQPVQDKLNEKGQMTLASLNKLIEQFQV